MKVPDKIYIQTNAGEAISSKWTTIPFRDFENAEYIRSDSLQQERSEVDFKIEERKQVHDAVDNVFPEDGDFMSEVDFRKILKDTARYFYELGKAKKKGNFKIRKKKSQVYAWDCLFI